MPTINSTRIATRFAALLLFALAAAPAAQAAPPPTPTPTPPLNEIRIGQCYDPNRLRDLIAAEEGRGLVMDARPFAINQSTGRLSFSGSTGRVSVAHMNPFAYDYSITVAQQELLTTALTDFLKFLLPPNLSTLAELQSGRVGAAGVSLATPSKLAQIADRIDGLKPDACKSSANPKDTKSPACVAAGEMYETFDTLRNSGLLGGGGPFGPALTTITASQFTPAAVGAASTPAIRAYTDYAKDVTKLRDEEADAYQTCAAATALNTKLGGYNFDAYFAALDSAQQGVTEVTDQARDLEALATAFRGDTELKDAKPTIRCKGYNCADQFDAFAKAALEILGVYVREIAALRQNAVRMQRMHQFTEQLKTKEGVFARTFTVIKKFEMSQATVSVNRTKINRDQDPPAQQQAQSGQVGGGGGGNGNGNGGAPSPVVTGGSSSDGDAPVNRAGGTNQSGTAGAAAATPTPASGGGGGASGAGNNLAPAGQLNEVIQIGQPRFALSGGLVYSPLPRRTFESVQGFALDAQGNPTGDGSANVVGFGENSSRRAVPMLLLNTRLTDLRPVNLYFSWGVSGNHNGNFDIDYLFGPSVSFLKDRAFLTIGAYGGQTQNLVADVAVGDALPDTIGDAKLYRKGMTWKPGFSFSYNFSRVKPREVAPGTASRPSTPAADLRNEIRIGSIPFNLALGLVYTSLEQRTYDEVVGFARDRRGELTNGETLTRVVGLVSSSDYRLTPALMLHSRLTKFGRHDFYFTTGVTGKKTDNNFDIEYLIGGTVNVYRRKVFLTVGGFAGKQELLGGDFFEGAAIAKTQSVTKHDRYVWKPAFSFSYDISKIAKRVVQ